MAITKVTRTLLSTGIVDNSNATAITIDSSENVGIGTSSPSSFSSGADNLVVGTGSGDNGITLYSGTTSVSRLHFADGTSSGGQYDGFIIYDHNGQAMSFGTGATGGVDVTLNSSGNVGIGRTPTAYGSFKVLDLAGSSGAIQKLIHTGSTVELQSYASSTVGAVGTATSHPLLFTTGDTERMRIDSSGNVGIGVTNPADYYAESLVVNSADEGGITIRCSSTDKAYLMFADGTTGSTAYRGYIGYDHGNDSMNMASHDYMNFYTAGLERIRINSSGNVGIGTTSPTNPLHLLSTQTDFSPSFLIKNSSTANGSVASIRFSAGSSATGFVIGKHSEGHGDANAVFINQETNAPMAFSTNGTERMRIDSSGRVMVNQTSVSAASAGDKMQVADGILTTGSLAGYFWENRSGMTIAAQSGWGGWYSTSTASHFLYSDGANRASIGRTSGTYTALSDVNKKKDFEDSTVGLAAVMQLKPKKFRMLEDADDAPKKLGFIAQDVEHVIPEAYVEDTNEDASGVENTFIGLTDRPIIAALTKAIQEQQTIIDNLTTRIETLENA